MPKRVGLYGGSFNPIHLGHVNLAVEMLDKCVDEVWFCPNHINPLKLSTPPINCEHRLTMIHLALSNVPCTSVLSLELESKTPSYTFDTLQSLLQDPHINKDIQLSLIIGEDAAADFAKWKRAEDIANLVPIFVGLRSKSDLQKKIDADPFLKKVLTLIETHLFDVSSTTIRDRLSQGKFCGHLLDEKVLAYIRKHRLYC